MKRKIDIGKVVRSVYFTIAFVLVAGCFYAQPVLAKEIKGEDVRIFNDSILNKLEIEFDCVVPINDLLVLITDSSGNTVFLECQRMFSGKYKHTVDFNKCARGSYDIKIIRDNLRMNRRIEID